MYNEEAEQSSRFVHKLGLYKLQCCLLMNGLVHEANEVTITDPDSSLNLQQQLVVYGISNESIRSFEEITNMCHFTAFHTY
jgi:UDP-glucose:glycoprotein glucosyltransferase